MQAVILAGGLGTRLRPVTETIPKPMVAVNGKPFLYHLVGNLGRNNIVNIVLLVGHLGEKIEEELGDGSQLAVSLSYSREEKLLGTGGAIKNADEFLENEFIVLNGDTYLPIDYCEMISRWEEVKSEADAMMVLLGSSQMVAPPNVLVNTEAMVMKYDKDDPSGMTHTDAGIQIFKKNVFADLEPGAEISLEREIFPRVISAGKMAAFITTQPFFDMGTPSGLEKLERFLKDEQST